MAAATSAKVPLEIAALHAAIVRWSASRSRWSSADRGSGESISRRAPWSAVRLAHAPAVARRGRRAPGRSTLEISDEDIDVPPFLR
jgi:hypothetical protein